MKYLSIALIAFLSGCATVQETPPLKAFTGNQHWVIQKDMEILLQEPLYQVTVPKGFVLDFSSVPKDLWSKLSPHGEYQEVMVLHDYLYWTQQCTRQQADNLLLQAMRINQVKRLTQLQVYANVRSLGAAAWNHNLKQKQQGHIRIIPEEYSRIPDNTAWPDYQRYLTRQGLLPPRLKAVPAYCALGDEVTL